MMQSISGSKAVVIGADFNAERDHRGDEEVKSWFGIQERMAEG